MIKFLFRHYQCRRTLFFCSHPTVVCRYSASNFPEYQLLTSRKEMTYPKHYVSPQIEVILVKNEGGFAVSGEMEIPGFGDGGSMQSSISTVGNSYIASSASDAENRINHILTIGR